MASRDPEPIPSAKGNKGNDAVVFEPPGTLPDLDEDLRTFAQSSAEIERWRRLSVRGLKVAPSARMEEGERNVEHGATTAPGTIAAPCGDTHEEMLGALVARAASPSSSPSRPDPDATAPVHALSDDALEKLGRARKSFPPPKDTPSAPPGARVVLPGRDSTRSSRPSVKVPRPSTPPDDSGADSVRSQRASDPEGGRSAAAVRVPKPARLPSIPSSDHAEPQTTMSMHRSRRTVPSEGAIEIDGRWLLAAFFGLVLAVAAAVYLATT